MGAKLDFENVVMLKWLFRYKFKYRFLQSRLECIKKENLKQ